jgi:hypothetical protein
MYACAFVYFGTGVFVSARLNDWLVDFLLIDRPFVLTAVSRLEIASTLCRRKALLSTVKYSEKDGGDEEAACYLQTELTVAVFYVLKRLDQVSILVPVDAVDRLSRAHSATGVGSLLPCVSFSRYFGPRCRSE